VIVPVSYNVRYWHGSRIQLAHFIVTLIMRPLVTLLASTLVFAAPLAAQTIPRFAAELSAGAGPRPLRSGEVWYAGKSEGYVRAGLTARLGSPGRVRPVVTAEYSLDIRGDQVSLCGVAPNGSCFQYFPNTDGFAAGVGVRAVPVTRLAVGTSVGLARYSETARFVDADVALGITRRFHLLAHWRRLEWKTAHGDKLWFQPITVGMRMPW
jgi:hypothetical protein